MSAAPCHQFHRGEPVPPMGPVDTVTVLMSFEGLSKLSRSTCNFSTGRHAAVVLRATAMRILADDVSAHIRHPLEHSGPLFASTAHSTGSEGDTRPDIVPA